MPPPDAAAMRRRCVTALFYRARASAICLMLMRHAMPLFDAAADDAD